MAKSDLAKDLIERAAWTAGQHFFTVLLAIRPGSGLIDLPWAIALTTSAGAAVVSLLTTLLQYIPALRRRIGDRFWLDLVLRLVKTFVSSFLGTIGAMQFDVLAFDWGSATDLAAITTLAALAKGFLAAGRDGTNSPSTIHPENYRSVYASAPRHVRVRGS